MAKKIPTPPKKSPKAPASKRKAAGKSAPKLQWQGFEHFTDSRWSSFPFPEPKGPVQHDLPKRLLGDSERNSPIRGHVRDQRIKDRKEAASKPGSCPKTLLRDELRRALLLGTSHRIHPALPDASVSRMLRAWKSRGFAWSELCHEPVWDRVHSHFQRSARDLVADGTLGFDDTALALAASKLPDLPPGHGLGPLAHACAKAAFACPWTEGPDAPEGLREREVVWGSCLPGVTKSLRSQAAAGIRHAFLSDPRWSLAHGDDDAWDALGQRAERARRLCHFLAGDEGSSELDTLRERIEAARQADLSGGLLGLARSCVGAIRAGSASALSCLLAPMLAMDARAVDARVSLGASIGAWRPNANEGPSKPLLLHALSEGRLACAERLAELGSGAGLVDDDGSVPSALDPFPLFAQRLSPRSAGRDAQAWQAVLSKVASNMARSLRSRGVDPADAGRRVDAALARTASRLRSAPSKAAFERAVFELACSPGPSSRAKPRASRRL